MRAQRSRTLLAAALLSTALTTAPHTQAAPSPLTITAPLFPAGFALGVSSDPLGLQQLLWAPVIGFDQRLQPYAELASRVPTLNNGDVRINGGSMEVTIHLKQGLRFSDGSALTAQDLAFGLRLNLDPALGNSFGLDEISHYSTPNAQTLVLQFHDLYGAYLAYAMPPALPRRYLERKYHTTDIHQLAVDYAADPYTAPQDVFSGPYKLQEVAPGQRITFQANPYFTALSPARSGRSDAARPQIRYLVLSNDQTTLARDLHARATGIDLALGFGPAALSSLQNLGASGFSLHILPSLAVEHLELNMATPALRDLRVREALQAALDKQALVRAMFPTIRQPSDLVATSILPPASPYHDPAAPLSRYDPALARRLLQEAGYTPAINGPGKHLTLTLTAPADPSRQREADLLVHAWANVGVRVRERLVSASPADHGGFYAPYAQGGILARRDFDLALFDLQLGPDPATVAALFDPDRIPSAISQGALRRNFIGIDDQALASLPETAQSALDQRSRILGYDKLQRKVNQLLPFIVLYNLPQIVVDDGAIQGLYPSCPQEGGIFCRAWGWQRRTA